MTLVDQFHPAIWDDPESVWDRVRDYLCLPRSNDEARDQVWQTRVDLIEDLMFHHPEAFIDRIEVLADECPHIREVIATAYVGGRAPDPGLDRFWALQTRLQPDVEALGDVQ